MGCTMGKKDIEVTPIRRSPSYGKITDTDACVVIGNSKPDFIMSPQETSKSPQEVQKGEPQRDLNRTQRDLKETSIGLKETSTGLKTHKTRKKQNQRVRFTPNKPVSKLIRKMREDGRSVGECINHAIEQWYGKLWVE